MTSPEVAASSKQEESACNQSQVLVVDPDNGELSSQHEESDSLKPSVEVNQSPIPSPASNVEIVMSDDSKYQKLKPGFPLIGKFIFLKLEPSCNKDFFLSIDNSIFLNLE